MSPRSSARKTLRSWCAGGPLILIGALVAAALPDSAPEEGAIGTVQPMGTVKLNRAIIDHPQPLHDKDQVDTSENASATLIFDNGPAIKLGEKGTFVVHQPRSATSSGTIGRLAQGILYYFSTRQPFESQIQTEHATAAPRGTEFVLETNHEWTRLMLYDGQAALQNAQGIAEIGRGGTAMAERGQAPKAVLETVNIVQWWLHYPGVLNPSDLPWTPGEQTGLETSLTAYQSGDLRVALVAYPGYPSPEEPTGEARRIYLASLYLGVGEVGKAQRHLQALSTRSSVARGLEWMIAAVQNRPEQEPGRPGSATEALGLSYYLQARQTARLGLQPALDAATNAVHLSAEFGFGWARVAELEFSFGRIQAASMALRKALDLAPANAQVHTLHAFLLSAQDKLREASQAFDRALELDPGLGDAWLGRGLIRIRRGDRSGGREDLRMAVIMEVNRSSLHSYLGKAFADAGDIGSAYLELRRARVLDRNDPTPWLYSALLSERSYRFSTGIEELETSQTLNENRSLFRSRLLLDQDRAVRGANLAALYGDAGMNDVAVREAARAVSYDYGNASAHLFLSDSFNQLRDPTRFNLRYETVWFNELLLANLLAPVGAGRLSHHISQQEYSKFFESDGLHLDNATEGRTDGVFSEQVSQFGTFGGSSYALDLDYQHNNGIRVNNGLNDIEWYTTLKQQITSHDTALALIKYEDYHSGDNFQYYDPSAPPPIGPRPYYRFDEHQEPIAVAGWHHEWSPGMHSLLLGGRLENEQHLTDRAAPQLAFLEFSNGQIQSQIPADFDVDYRNRLEIYTGEFNQICQWEKLTLSAGARGQGGTFRTEALLNNPSGSPPPFFNGTSTNSAAAAGFSRMTGYGYLTAQLLEGVWVTTGLTYDGMSYPRNYRNPPIAPGEDHRSQLGPKAALVWEVAPQATIRGIFTRSLGGVSLDESYRLEPTQLAGFPQAFRTLIPESIVGSVAAPEYQIYGAALDLKLSSRTYAGVQVERLEAKVRRSIGIFADPSGDVPVQPDSTLEQLDYHENAVSASVNQLIGETLVIGASYRFSDVNLQDAYPNIPLDGFYNAPSQRADLHQATGYVLFNYHTGFFANAETHWYHQSPSTSAGSPVSGDDFFQENLFAGYRFAQDRAALLLGILNLTGRDYHLNPLTTYAEVPRERTFLARFSFQF